MQSGEPGVTQIVAAAESVPAYQVGRPDTQAQSNVHAQHAHDTISLSERCALVAVRNALTLPCSGGCRPSRDTLPRMQVDILTGADAEGAEDTGRDAPVSGSGTNKDSPCLARIGALRELHGPASERSCVHVELDVGGSGIAYETGDHVRASCSPLYQLTMEFKNQGIAGAGWLPSQRYVDLPALGEGIHVSCSPLLHLCRLTGMHVSEVRRGSLV